MFSAELVQLAQALGEILVAKKLKLVLAESCTGGLVAALMTEIAGSSAWFEGGFTTYSNQMKIDQLGVSPSTLDVYGAVSENTAIEMAHGALNKAGAAIAASITGIAGPAGGSREKPVGMVCFAWVGRELAPITSTLHFAGDRQQVRLQAVLVCVQGLIKLAQAY
ncbi:MAG TPA: CinA family protein [Methylophilaceae bacterium]|jgi:nicotinamide-nucleotide amidase